jgi:hypothetical protein
MMILRLLCPSTCRMTFQEVELENGIVFETKDNIVVCCYLGTFSSLQVIEGCN